MINLEFNNENFLVNGSFNFGILGYFKSDNIIIEDTIKDILNDINKENSFHYKLFFPYLKNGYVDENTIIKVLTNYYNAKEKQLNDNIKQITDTILYNLFEYLIDCEYPFWEIKEILILEEFEKYNKDNLTEEIYSDKNKENFYSWTEQFWNKPNNNTINKVDLESNLRKMFPMFNFDKLFKSIVLEYIVFRGEFIIVQFSDTLGKDLFCSAYFRLDENFTFLEWDNF